MKTGSCLALLAALFLSHHFAYGQDGAPGGKRPRRPDDYQVRTIKELPIESSDSESRGNKEETMIVHPAILPSQVRVTYTGSTRKMPQIKKEVLRQWARLYAGSPEGYTEPYQTELLFREGEDKHWLAVKKDSLSRFKKELKKGDGLDLYLIRVGSAKVSDEWELVLLIESFQKPK